MNNSQQQRHSYEHYFSAADKSQMGTRDSKTILDKILDGESQLNKEQHAI